MRRSRGWLMRALLCVLPVLRQAGGMDTTGLQPYMDIRHPAAGSAFLLNEDAFCVLAFHHLNASLAARAEFRIEILDGSERRISAASGHVDGQTELNADGSQILNVNLNGLGKGAYGLRVTFLVDRELVTYLHWHPFQVQRPVFAAGPGSHEVTFPAGTPGGPAPKQGSEPTHKVVALVRVRNCARAVGHFLQALSFFVHQIVVLDDASVDDTARVVQAVAAESRVARILAKGSREIEDPDPWGDMQALLQEGRALGGTHFVVLHSDELLSASFLVDGSWWSALRGLEVGESLSVTWIHFWKSMRYARADWMMQHAGPRSLRVVDVAFRDDGSCSYLSNKHADSGLAAHSHDTVEIQGQTHGLLHLGYVDWIGAMHRIHLRRLLARLQLADASDASIDSIMAPVLDEAGVHGVACSAEIFGNWSQLGVDVAAAYGLRANNVYAQVFVSRRQLSSKDEATAYLPSHPAAGDGNRCWEAQAAQSLLAKYPHLEVVSASCEGEINLPQDARERAITTFSLPSSLVDSVEVNLIGTPVVDGVPKVCVLVSTKRPGGIDAILHSLARQSSKDFELVMVDELWQREASIRARAAELGIPITAISISKPKANVLAFGFQNAWNTGLGSCRAPYIAIVNDYAWLADDFIREVVGFYEDVREDLPLLSDRRLALLSFPIIQYAVPEDFLDRDRLFNNSLLSVFRQELKTPPRDLGWQESDPLGPYDTQADTFKPHWFWDGQAMVLTRGAMEAVNGFDEVLDYGNDCHMQNIRDRVALLGGQVWLAPAKILVQEIDHHNWFPKAETKEFLLYNRLAKDTNLDRWSQLIRRIRSAAYPNRATNFGFDLSDYFQRQHDLEEDEDEDRCKWMSTAENWRCHI